MSKTRIRALILDYGGVISQPQNPENVIAILKSVKRDINDFQEVYRSQREQYDRGQISGEQYWIRILQSYQLEPKGFDLARLIQEDVKSWMRPNASTIRFLRESRSKIYKLAMISNMTNDSLAYLRGHYDWLGLFDELCFSCEIGKNKPEREIYEACLGKLGMRPSECLFVDDSAENVEGAMQVGMSAIQFRSFSEFILELDEMYCLTQ